MPQTDITLRAGSSTTGSMPDVGADPQPPTVDPLPVTCVCAMFVQTRAIWSEGSCPHTLGWITAQYPVVPYVPVRRDWKAQR